MVRSAPIEYSSASMRWVAKPAELAAQAAFLAQLHRTDSVEEWLAYVIRERVELEEAAFIEMKQTLATQVG